MNLREEEEEYGSKSQKRNSSSKSNSSGICSDQLASNIEISLNANEETNQNPNSNANDNKNIANDEIIFPTNSENDQKNFEDYLKSKNKNQPNSKPIDQQNIMSIDQPNNESIDQLNIQFPGQTSDQTSEQPNSQSLNEIFDQSLNLLQGQTLKDPPTKKRKQKVTNRQNLKEPTLTINDELDEEIFLDDSNLTPDTTADDDSTFFTSNKIFISNSKSGCEDDFDQAAQMAAEEPTKKRPQGKKTSASKAKPKAKLTAEELHSIRMEQLKQFAMNLCRLDDPSINISESEYEELLTILNEERRRHISNRDFNAGNRLNIVIETAVRDHSEREKLELQRREYQKYADQHAIFLHSLDEFDSETRRLLEEATHRNEAAMRDLEKRHQDEIADHYAKWNAEAKVRQYNHASQRLMANRKTVEILLDQCRFSEAKDVQEVIDTLEKEEEKVAAAQMQHDYEDSLRALAEKHENESIFLRQKCDMKLVQIQQKRKIQRATFLNKEKKFQKIRDQVSSPDKLWNAMQAKRINQMYKKRLPTARPDADRGKWRMTDSASRRRGKVDKLAPLSDEKDASVSKVKTARQPITSTVIKLPPLKMKAIRKSRLAQSVR